MSGFFATLTKDGDKQMLEYTKAGEGKRPAMILLHDDAEREYAYGPAQGLPATASSRSIPPRELDSSA